VATPLSRPPTPPVPTQEPRAFSAGVCGNCGAQLTGPFCSQCGEKKFSRQDYSLGHFVEEAIDGLTHFDSRFLRTLKLLLTKPGELSNAFFHGGLSVYMYLGFRRAYQTSRTRSAINAVILAAAIDSSLVLYQILLFHTTLWTT
jgi:hypothetical protein